MAESNRVGTESDTILDPQREQRQTSAAGTWEKIWGRWKRTFDQASKHPRYRWIGEALAATSHAVPEFIESIRWRLNARVQHLYDRYERMAALDAKIRKNSLAFFQAAAKAYADMSWARVALLTIFLMAAIGTADSLIGRPVSFRLIYMLPIWVATRLGGGGSGFLATLIVGVFCTIGDTPFEAIREESQVLNFVVRWISLGAFLLIVLQVEEALKLARERATRDSLTGLANRYTIEIHAEEAIASASSKPSHLHLAVIDCDDFKLINDTNGHAFGDHALRMLGKRLEAETHGFGSVARLGGDEFIVLFLGVDRSRAIQALEAADAGFRRMLATINSTGGVSYGLATYGRDGDSYSRLYRVADERMYSKKRLRAQPLACIQAPVEEALRDAS